MTGSRGHWDVRLSLAAVIAVLVSCCSAVMPASASASVAGRAFGYFSPTDLPPGGEGQLTLYVYAAGANANSEPVKVIDQLPQGLTATGGRVLDEQVGGSCTGTTEVVCEVKELPAEGEQDRPAQIVIPVKVETDPSSAPTPIDRVEVEGGGATSASSTTVPVTFGSGAAGLGFANIDAWLTNADGTSDLEAGSHPYETTVAFALNTVLNERKEEEPAGGDPHDIDVRLPPGLVGNPNAATQCSRKEFEAGELAEPGVGCPASSQVGVDTANAAAHMLTLPIYNMVPPPGVAAQFAFVIENVRTYLDARVRSGGNYGITVHTDDLVQDKVVANVATFWGMSPSSSTPFLTLPTSCGQPLAFSAAIFGTWENEAANAESSVVIHNADGEPVTIGGCNHLVHFEPSIEVSPDTSQADTPAGLMADLRVPQDVNPEGLATSGLKNTTVTLPVGMAINPGQATGLAACQPSEENIGGENEEFDGPPSCPAASKVGTDEITTPLLPDKLEGSVYVLQSNPPDLKLLLAASGDGVNIKLVGTVQLNEATGQLTTTFDNTPDFPLTEFKLSFSGGAQAALVTPPTCAVYQTSTVFTPWSGLENALSEGRFAIDSGPAGTPCQNPLPFAPTLTAGATTDQAGGYTDFSMLLQRGDGQQRIGKLQFKAPEGLLGMIAKIPLCKEPGASKGECPEASQIGDTVVGAGPGPYPLFIPQTGQPPAPIYLTEGYSGTPFGLSIVVPIIAGPFNLGTEIVRAQIAVDPHTAQITITTNPLPTIIKGIPADLRSIYAVINKPGFMFNPTNCNPMNFDGTATSTEGVNADLAYHFQVGSCQALKFKPNFKVSTTGKTSKANGASLAVKIVYPTTAPGANQASSQSNIASVKVDLPKQLPSRLTTLQKACTNAQFEANPAGCPAASLVGHAKVLTPILPVPLAGPAYFVSHGGEAFPSLIVVLQGYGVTVDLVGTTFISKAGITSSTFKATPDVPFSSFELTLPQGKYSALTANVPVKDDYSLCGQKLSMPTAFVGQDGAVIHESTPITITGCAKKTALTRAQKLAKALKACKQDKQKAKRASCVRAAHARYGPPKKSKSSKRKG